MHRVDCNEQRHARAILDIFNDAIANSTALYDYAPRTMETMTAWFADKQAQGLPVIGYENEQGELLGFASYGAFRSRPANKYTAEHSIYVHPGHRGAGIGRRLLQDVIAAARERDMHTLIGGIDADNEASITLHLRAGFVHAGTVREAAFKFGRWLDLAFYQLIMDTPRHPVDG
ncbi:GNAT family N-acetyltransferase [Paludibacterium yongneupense]|uniref:GNAT family N-acetyltransferase n=1 Tax=Paludibacterium yongneupense TaxID=400061 RepID=UPI00041F35F2|nr:GNAT family N-acetyltransferase [Paludibacterium yongneupense]